jgi:sulfur relay (sulfurtransferase) DsrF/TusC family protein
MAGGTQNRNAKIALEKHLSVVGKTKLCGCPIHKKDGKKSIVDSTIFNGQKSSKDGLQGMCKIGKKGLDSFKHKMNGWKLIFIFDKLTDSKILDKLKLSLEGKSLQISLYNSFTFIFNKLLSDVKGDTKSDIFFEFMSIADSVIGGKNSISLLNQMNIYNLNLNEEDFFQLIEDFDPSNILSKDEIKNLFSLQDMFCDNLNLYVSESSKKDLELHHHSNFRTNLTKIREVYNEDSTPFLTSNGIHVRINKWNTQVQGKSDSRVERYFPDGDYKIANSRMREINKTGLSADHIWPISLGGKHDTSNLEGMPLLENIRKRNNLNVDLLLRVSQNPEKHISGKYLEIFRNICTGEITQDKVVEVERSLRLAVEDWNNYVSSMDVESKENFVIRLLTEHNVSHTKHDKVIKDYFTKK